jgi:uncharacterized Zn ribbon protein
LRLTVKRLGSRNKESSWACPEEGQKAKEYIRVEIQEKTEIKIDGLEHFLKEGDRVLIFRREDD